MSDVAICGICDDRKPIAVLEESKPPGWVTVVWGLDSTLLCARCAVFHKPTALARAFALSGDDGPATPITASRMLLATTAQTLGMTYGKLFDHIVERYRKWPTMSDEELAKDREVLPGEVNKLSLQLGATAKALGIEVQTLTGNEGGSRRRRPRGRD